MSDFRVIQANFRNSQRAQNRPEVHHASPKEAALIVLTSQLLIIAFLLQSFRDHSAYVFTAFMASCIGALNWRIHRATIIFLVGVSFSYFLTSALFARWILIPKVSEIGWIAFIALAMYRFGAWIGRVCCSQRRLQRIIDEPPRAA